VPAGGVPEGGRVKARGAGKGSSAKDAGRRAQGERGEQRGEGAFGCSGASLEGRRVASLEGRCASLEGPCASLDGGVGGRSGRASVRFRAVLQGAVLQTQLGREAGGGEQRGRQG